mmetsp:Transcript_15871/g.20336  ORF Transcript_15871/g.20336 Transcript_15871/m.20336 type:complete len:822 (+) Transcript_15871:462-2927(+)
MTSIIMIILSTNDIGNGGVKSIADALKGNTSLTSLNLSTNEIGNGGAKSLADALKVNTTLASLNLKENQIGNEGATFLANALKVNTSLASLNLRYTQISDEGAKSLADALEANTSLTELSVPANVHSGIIGKIKARILSTRRTQKRKFLEALKSDEKAPLNRSRLMFVGQGKAGKSATVRSLLGKGFNPDWDSTIGADISERMTSSATSKWRNPDDLKGDFTSRFAARLMVAHSNTRNRPNAKATAQVGKTKEKTNLVLPSHINKMLNEEAINDSTKTTNATVSNDPESARIRNVQHNESSSGRIRPSLKNTSVQVKQEPNDEIVREFEEKLFLDAKRDVNSLTLSLWDFGGQQVFYAMHHIFLTQSGVYILLFDMRELLEPTKREEASKYLLFWLRSVKLHAPKASLILTGTFLADVGERENLRTVDIILRELIKATFSQIVPNIDESFIYFPIDNKEGLGIDKLRGIVEESARNDDGVFENVSIRWMAFLDKIYSERDKVSYLTLSRDIRDIGLEVGISNSIEQEAALALFHERGLLIHLTSTLVLKNIVVIKPQWLIVVLSKVICDGNLHIDKDQFKHVGLEEDLKATFEKGLASRDFLEYVWKGECELEQVDFFLDLMQRTMLLSKWIFSKNELYLIPSLLEDYLVEKETIKGRRCVIDFSNNFLPIGVFQRLLCLCVAHSVRGNENESDHNELIMEPSLHKNYATIEFEPGFKVHLLQDEEAQTITIFVRNDEFAGKCLRIVQAMLRKVNHDVMGSGLNWEIYLDDVVADELRSLREAQEENASPWFSCRENKHNVKTSVTPAAENIDLAGFLDSL